MREIIKLGIILLVICIIASIALAMTYDATIEQILAQRKIINEQARKEVLPNVEEFKAVDEETFNKIVSENDNITEVYSGYINGNIVGFAIKTVPQGYGGAVEVITGIDLKGVVSGVRVGNHQETPGLGANATLPFFYTRYDNKSIDENLEVVKTPPTKENEVQAISGATITSDAVTTGVNYSIDAFKNVLAQ